MYVSNILKTGKLCFWSECQRVRSESPFVNRIYGKTFSRHFFKNAISVRLAHLFGSLVEIDAGHDELVPLLGAGDELLPPLGDILGDVPDALRVVMVRVDQRLRALLHLDGGGVRLLQERRG